VPCVPLTSSRRGNLRINTAQAYEFIKMTEILPRLFLGGINNTYDREFLHAENITHVLTIFEGNHSTDAMATKGVLHMSIRMYDSDAEPIYDVFERAVAFIHDAMNSNGAVYVHCLMGISRSPTLVAAYLMSHRAMNAEQALAFLIEKRPIVCPNDGFRAALKRWESPSSAAAAKT
jgi:predicted protein tyrosine phosphatase